MPYPAPPVADEREGHAAYLAQHQLYLRASVAGLPEELASRWSDVSSDAVLRAARAADPDTPVPVHRAPWTPRDVPSWSVRWVWLHLVTELARHAGHADIIREQLDGRLGFELLASWEGHRA